MKRYKSLMLIVIVLSALCPVIASGQNMKKLSVSDSLAECEQVAVKLDARLTICEQAHVDSLLARNRERVAVTKTHRKQVKVARRKGFVWGALAGVVATFVTILR